MNMQTQKSNLQNTFPVANLKNISEEHFERVFQPKLNHIEPDIDARYRVHGALFDPYDCRQIEHVKEVLKNSPRSVWTLMDVNDQDVLVSGYQFATRVGYCRLGYVISKTPVNEGVEYYVPLTKRLA